MAAMAAIPSFSYSVPTSDHDRGTIEATICHAGLELETVQRQVTKSTLEIQRLESLGVPIHRLIDDVLLEIFGYILKRPHGWQHPAVTLSHVCRRWGALTLSSPHLWTTLSLDLEGDRVCKYLGRSLASFLSLSRSLPLDVSLFGVEDDRSARYIARIRRIVDAFSPCINRWKMAYVHFNCSASSVEPWSLLKCEPDSYSQLEVLNLVGFEDFSGTTAARDRISEFPILRAPSLRKLVLSTWESAWPVPGSWTQLRELEIVSWVDHAIMALWMLACPNLSKLRLRVDRSDTIPDLTSPIEDLVHHSLTSLSISFVVISHFSELLLPQAPALQTLCLSSKSRRRVEENLLPSTQATILRIINSCTSSLINLKLHRCVFRDTDLICILQLLPTLKCLDIDSESSVLTLNVFERLTPAPDRMHGATPASAVLCPNLVSLNLRMTGDSLSAADQRIDLTFSLVISRIARGIGSLRIVSDAWSTIQGYNLRWMSSVPSTALEEALIRQSKKEEVERRVAEVRDTWGIQELYLEPESVVQEWDHREFSAFVGVGFRVHFVVQAVVYERGRMQHRL